MEEILNIISNYGPALTAVGSIIAAAALLIKEIKNFISIISERLDSEYKETKQQLKEIGASNLTLSATVERLSKENAELKEKITHVKND